MGYILLRYHANPLTCNMRLSSDAFVLGEGPTRGDYLTWAFMPLRRIVPLRGTPSCAFGAALLQGPTRGRNILVPSHQSLFLHQFQRRCKVADKFPLPPAEVVIDDGDTGEVKFHCRTAGGEQVGLQEGMVGYERDGTAVRD